jgi:hypothetical protein
MGLSKVHTTWFTIALLVAAAGAGLFLWQRQQNDDEIQRLKEQIATLSGVPVAELESSTPTETASEEIESTIKQLPVVVFEPAGRFDDALIATFRDEVINPLTQYSADNGIQVTAFLIEPAQTEDEYVVNTIYADGAYSGFLTGSPDISWTPECLDAPCELSDIFVTRFPDIAERTQ